MSFLLYSFYYSFSKNYIEKYQKNKKFNKNNDINNEDPIITIDMNFDNTQIIDDYTEYYTTNKLLDSLLINTNKTIKYVSSFKSIVNDEYELDFYISNHNFSNDNYSNFVDLSFS